VVAAVLAFLLPVGALKPGSAAVQSCTVHVVAHEDDDLLFMNPDISHAIAAGGCVRTIFMTAGDDGRRETYWRGREFGERAAYARMARVPDQWTETSEAVGDRRVYAVHLNGTSVSLVFLRLPDGFTGRGFAVHNFQSMQKLWEGRIPLITPVDGSAPYDRSELIDTLKVLFENSNTTVLRIQDFRGWAGAIGGRTEGDHHDHYAAAYFAYQAQRLMETPPKVTAYRGYPIDDLPNNLGPVDVDEKKSSFYLYARHDANLGCRDESSCLHDPVRHNKRSRYYNWLYRQYQLPDPAADGSVELRSVNGRCLTAADAQGRQDTAVQLRACTHAGVQRWTMTPTGELRGAGNLCLDLRGPSAESGFLQLERCSSAVTQGWTLTVDNELRAATAQCIGMFQQRGGAAPRMQACTGLPEQKWRLV
jgi:LmbE family N-acetylglucosaminyl deacetylase